MREARRARVVIRAFLAASAAWAAAGCAGFATRDAIFTKRFTGTMGMRMDSLSWTGNYVDGFLEGTLEAERIGYGRWSLGFNRGNPLGPQVFTDPRGRVRRLTLDTAGHSDSIVDADGKAWNSSDTIPAGARKILSLYDRFYGVRIVRRLDDSIPDGMEFMIDEGGDTVCREEYRAGERKPSSGQCSRSTGDILAVFRKRIMGLRKAYNESLRKGGFRAKIYLRMEIAPDGSIVMIHPSRILTIDTAFTRVVTDSISRWRFPSVRSPYPDIVTVPLSFTQ